MKDLPMFYMAWRMSDFVLFFFLPFFLHGMFRDFLLPIHPVGSASIEHISHISTTPRSGWKTATALVGISARGGHLAAAVAAPAVPVAVTTAAILLDAEWMP